ncbi:class I SAM-dependent methyltransferase [Streptomyces sp. NPDC020742]|uniref:class I SAM-dependent methyltransferase n=1 Tax=Streptomyces sp. NPDC020742 TaxID=3154897 RepID=UPI003409CC83
MSPEHAARGLSFGEIVERYDRFRPGLPEAAVDWLVPDGCKTVVDLAAGTGALTRSLVDHVEHVIAVEPDPRMRETLGRNCPDARVLSGTGEQIPLPDGQADAVLISMAWHWMDPQRAVPEIARVLRSGGTFGVAWNHRALSVPWVAELDSFTRELRARAAAEGPTGTGAAPTREATDPPTGSLFSVFTEMRMTWSKPVTAGELVGLLGTDASAIALPVDARSAVDEQVAAYVREELGLSGDKTIDLPVACRCLRATKNA